MPSNIVSKVLGFLDLHSPWLWVVLLEFNLVGSNWLAFSVEDQESCACSSLIDGADVGLVRCN